MKRLILMICMILTLLSVPCITAQAVKVYPNAYALYTVGWGGGPPYPEGVTGVWSETGSTDRLVIGIEADADTEQIKADILAQIENKESVSFLEQTYPRSLLGEIYGTLSEQYIEGICAVMVNEQENCVVVGADLANPTPELAALMEQYKAQYGDAVQFYQSTVSAVLKETAVPEEPVTETEKDETEEPPQDAELKMGLDIGGKTGTETAAADAVAEELLIAPDGLPDLETAGMESAAPMHRRNVFLLTAAGLVLLGGIVVLLRRRHQLLQGNTGGAETVTVPEKNMPALLRQTAASPPEGLRQRILDAAAQEPDESED